MKRMMLMMALILSYAIGAEAALYKIDASHSEVGFSVRHMVVANVKGRFDKYDGSFDFDEKKMAFNKIEVTVDPASVNTHDTKRDDHLRNPDFFDVKKFPKMTFKGERVELKDSKPSKVHGTLTIRGVTKPVVLDMDYRGTVTDPWGNEKLGFALTGKINRKDWGMTWNKTLDKGGLAVAEDVNINIEVEALKEKSK